MYLSLSEYSRGTRRECVECRKLFIAPVQGVDCEMPDGSILRNYEFIDTCPLCDNSSYGITWNLYFMDDLEPYRSMYNHVEPYTVDFD